MDAKLLAQVKFGGEHASPVFFLAAQVDCLAERSFWPYVFLAKSIPVFDVKGKSIDFEAAFFCHFVSLLERRVVGRAATGAL